MNLFDSIVLILSVLCEFMAYNIILGSERITFENDNTDFSIGAYCIIDQSLSNFGSCQLISGCPVIANKIRAGLNNHTICGYKKLEQIVCCPSISSTYSTMPKIIRNKLIDTMTITNIRSTCFNPITNTSLYKYIEIVGEPCTDETSGRQGKYRWDEQCPFYKYNNLPRLFSCCVRVICCPNLISSSVIDQKCLDYGRTFFNEKWEIQGPYTEMPPKNCLIAVPYVYGGEVVWSGKYPFMAALGFQNGIGGFRYDCGGTIISERYILTAGHCLESPDFGPVVTVRLGAILLNETTFQNQNIKDYLVIERIPHPDYKKRFYYNDIGLLLLDRQIEFNHVMRPACLPYSINISNFVTAMGWGLTEMGIRSPNLLEVKVEIFSHAECNQSYSRFPDRRLNVGIVDEIQVCAGSWTFNRDTCQGDSGGPLFLQDFRHSGLHNVVGITSVGQFCGIAGSPGVYTRVFPYVNWIQSIVWPNTG